MLLSGGAELSLTGAKRREESQSEKGEHLWRLSFKQSRLGVLADDNSGSRAVERCPGPPNTHLLLRLFGL